MKSFATSLRKNSAVLHCHRRSIQTLANLNRPRVFFYYLKLLRHLLPSVVLLGQEEVEREEEILDQFVYIIQILFLGVGRGIKLAEQKEEERAQVQSVENACECVDILVDSILGCSKTLVVFYYFLLSNTPRILSCLSQVPSLHIKGALVDQAANPAYSGIFTVLKEKVGVLRSCLSGVLHVGNQIGCDCVIGRRRTRGVPVGALLQSPAMDVMGSTLRSLPSFSSLRSPQGKAGWQGALLHAQFQVEVTVSCTQWRSAQVGYEAWTAIALSSSIRSASDFFFSTVGAIISSFQRTAPSDRSRLLKLCHLLLCKFPRYLVRWSRAGVFPDPNQFGLELTQAIDSLSTFDAISQVSFSDPPGGEAEGNATLPVQKYNCLKAFTSVCHSMQLIKGPGEVRRFDQRANDTDDMDTSGDGEEKMSTEKPSVLAIATSLLSPHTLEREPTACSQHLDDLVGFMLSFTPQRIKCLSALLAHLLGLQESEQMAVQAPRQELDQFLDILQVHDHVITFVDLLLYSIEITGRVKGILASLLDNVEDDFSETSSRSSSI